MTIAVDHGRWEVARWLLDRREEVASLGAVDPAGLALEKGQRALAERIAAQRWSPVVEGVRGRLRVSPSGEGGATRHVLLELENVGAAARSVPEDDPLALSWALTCDDELVPAPLARVEILSGAGWRTLAPGERWSCAVSRENDRAELDLITRIWPTLPPGRLHLSARYELELRRTVEPPTDARAFTLALPSCLFRAPSRVSPPIP